MRNTTLANLGMAIGSMGVFVVTGNGAYVAEALHDTADVASHGSRLYMESSINDQNSKKSKNLLKLGMLSVSALSLYAATRIGADILNGVANDVDTDNTRLNLASAGAIAAGNTYAYNQMSSIDEHSNASGSSLDHSKVDMFASWGLAGSIAAEALGVDDASQYGGFLFAIYTAAHLAVHALKPHKH